MESDEWTIDNPPQYVFFDGLPRKVKTMKVNEESREPFFVLDPIKGYTESISAPTLAQCTPLPEDQELLLREDYEQWTDEQLQMALDAAKNMRQVVSDKPQAIKRKKETTQRRQTISSAQLKMLQDPAFIKIGKKPENS